MKFYHFTAMRNILAFTLNKGQAENLIQFLLEYFMSPDDLREPQPGDNTITMTIKKIREGKSERPEVNPHYDRVGAAERMVNAVLDPRH